MSATELQALRALADDQRASISVDLAGDLERKGLVLRGWGGMHVLTSEGEAALLGLGSLIKP